MTIFRRRRVFSAIAAIAIWGCAGTTTPQSGSVPSSAATGPAPSASHAAPPPLPSPTERASSPTPVASVGPVTLDSVVYPYELTVPAHTLTLAWVPAQRAWDGTEGINLLGSPVVDKTGIADGGLVIFGAPAPAGLDAFFAVHAANGSRFHGCGEPTSRHDVTIHGDRAIEFVQSCQAQQTRAQVSIVHHGYGLGIFVSTAAGNESLALDHLIRLLDGLSWKTS